FDAEEEERFVFDDGPANRTAKLVTDEVVLSTREVREEAVRRQRLNTVVFKKRTVPLIGPALEHSVSHEAAGLAVFCRRGAINYAVLFDGVRRNCRIGSAGPRANGSGA